MSDIYRTRRFFLRKRVGDPFSFPVIFFQNSCFKGACRLLQPAGIIQDTDLDLIYAHRIQRLSPVGNKNRLITFYAAAVPHQLSASGHLDLISSLHQIRMVAFKLPRKTRGIVNSYWVLSVLDPEII